MLSSEEYLFSVELQSLQNKGEGGNRTTVLLVQREDRY